MYNNPYIPNMYNPQNSIDRINNQINELESMKKQLEQQPKQQPTNLTQNFQIAPTNREVIRYANSIDEVQRDVVIGDTPYFSKDLSILWIKNINGDIKTYELNEIIPQDEKDIQIQLLQEQINELRKGMIDNEQHNTNDVESKNESDTKRNDNSTRTATKTNKPTSVQRVSRSSTK